MNDLDVILKNAKEGQTINLSAGEYFTRGGNGYSLLNMLKPNCKLIGAGINQTIIKLIQPTDTESSTIFGIGANMTVQDLTVDAMTEEGVELGMFKMSGINLVGDNCVIRNCRSINTYGCLKNDRECFSIKIFYGKNALIDNCEVRSVKGSYHSAIGVNSGEIRNCRVFFPEPFSDYKYPFFAAYNCEDIKNGWVHHNSAYNATKSYYTDTGTVNGLIIENNTFYDTLYGVQFSMQDAAGETTQHGISNVKIKNNVFYLRETFETFVAGVLLDNTVHPYSPIGITTKNWINNISITNNFFGFKNKIIKMPYGYRQVLEASSQCTNPTDSIGIKNIYLADNQTHFIPNGIDPWIVRAKNVNNLFYDDPSYKLITI